MIESKHHRNDFLIERIAFFSDAIFAIAITLLIIEIHPPKIIAGDTEAIAWHKFSELLPELLGLVASFFLIGTAWLRHHSLFKYIDNYDFSFMLINMALMFTIILFPFSTSFLFNNLFAGGISKLQIYVYLGVPLASNLILYILFRRVKTKHMEQEADLRFHESLVSQKWVLISFCAALLWIIIMPLRIHFYGYMFFALISIGETLEPKKNKKKK